MEPSAKPVMQWWGSGGEAGLAVNGHAGEVPVGGLGGQAQMAPCTPLAPCFALSGSPRFLPEGSAGTVFPRSTTPPREHPRHQGARQLSGSPPHEKKHKIYLAWVCQISIKSQSLEDP